MNESNHDTIDQNTNEKRSQLKRSLIGTFMATLFFLLSHYMIRLFIGAPIDINWPSWLYYSVLVLAVVSFINQPLRKEKMAQRNYYNRICA